MRCPSRPESLGARAGIAAVMLWMALGYAHASESTPESVASWSFEGITDVGPSGVMGEYPGVVHGDPGWAKGVEGKSIVLDGGDDYVRVSDADTLSFRDATFSVSAWVNPYDLGRGQQMILAKNVYSQNQREWGLMLDSDNRFRLYLWQAGWQTLGGQTTPRPGHWYHVVATVDDGDARLFINGALEGQVRLGSTLPDTGAPLTIGGVDDNGRLRQLWYGALDEVRLYGDVLSPLQIRAAADRRTTPHEIPEVPEPYALWTGGEMPKSDDIPVLEGVQFSVIKPHEPQVDGGNWLLGVALAWHKGKLYASYGFNTGSENTASEQAHVRVSADGGKTWGKSVVIDAGEGRLGVSHGVFLSRGSELWAFQGAFYDHFQRTHTRAYVLDEATGHWRPRGVVVGDGFWPMQEPQKMANGNWIMAGARIGNGYPDAQGNPPAVAISHGADLTKWDLVAIPTGPGVANVWGESSVIVDGARILNVSRWGGRAAALAAMSTDYGRTWTLSGPSNLPMATSKPYTGTLSTGQNYLICTTTADSGGRRSPLTIAVSRPGEEAFCRVFVVRDAVFPEGPGPSSRGATLCYPYAVERDGKLYVGYAIKSHRTAEMAVIPVSALAVPDRVQIWDGGEIPKADAVPLAQGVEVYPIKTADPAIWMKGVHVVWHKGRLFASFGYNDRFRTQGENSPGEQAFYCVSEDAGRTWSDAFPIASGEGELGISHGVFLSHEGRLWSFNGAFYGKIGRVHTRAFVLDEATGRWKPRGTVIEGGFWPLQEPIQMNDGNWIMSGARIGDGHPAAVAISHGNDLTKWELVVIPKAPGKMWGESSVLVDGSRIVNIARYGVEAIALVAISEDYGRTWTRSRASNLPMATSRPFTGTLSTGQHYLVCTTTADSGTGRWPLTIAVTRPGEMTFRRILSLNSTRGAGGLMYPGAAEHDGMLYVGYTRRFTPEIAVVPVSSLAVPSSTESSDLARDPWDRQGIASSPVGNGLGPTSVGAGISSP